MILKVKKNLNNLKVNIFQHMNVQYFALKNFLLKVIYQETWLS